MRQILFLLFLALTATSYAQNANLRSYHFNLENGLAIQGYDPVSYFNKGQAIKGNSSIVSYFFGVKYYFSNAENKKTFDANPTKYEPQYGGWCAFAMGDSGKKVEIDPETFKIIYGKLYLFYNAYFTNTLTSWNKDENNLKAKADKNWISIYK